MKHFFILSLLIFIVTSSVSYSYDAYITYDDVYKRDGILFKKFTSLPFSGDIKKFPNEDNTKFFATDRYENGILVYDEFFNDNWSLLFKRNYKNWILNDGDYEYYYSDSSIMQS